MKHRLVCRMAGGILLIGTLLVAGIAVVAETAASPSGQTSEVEITFTAEPTAVPPGGCATLSWSVSGPHFLVALNGEEVGEEGTREVCPSETTEYILEVDTGETMEVRRVTVAVAGGSEPGPEPGVEPGEEASGEEPVDPSMLPPASALGATVPAWSAAGAKTASVTVEGAEVGAPISPYVYGTFLEHQGRCIYGGVWAEMLQDRKFYFPVNWYFPWGGRKLKSPWFANYPDTVVLMDETHAYVGKHDPEVFVDGVRPRGIVQYKLGLKSGKEYTGYVILAASGNVSAAVSLVWGPGADERQTVTLGKIGEGYTKFPVKFTAGADTGDGRLEIVGTGQGWLFIGPPSLMPADNIQGLRADTLALLKQLGFTVYRWPGGSFVTGYDWRNALGDRDKRPPALNHAYWSEDVESNDFGLDEFMTLCELLDTEAYIAVSAEKEADAQLAADEVEYLNGAADTPMGKLRAANGHPKPYNVRFFGVGNEMWYIPLAQYYPLQNKIAEAMWAVDPTIQLIAVGGYNDEGLPNEQNWSYGMLAHAAADMTFLSEHIYAEFDSDIEKHTADLGAATAAMMELHRGYRTQIAQLQGKDIRLALDEWNYGWGGRAEIYGEAAPRYYFRDALGIARGLHSLFASSDLVGMVNLHGVNVHGQVKTTDTAAAIEATGLAWSLYRHHFGTLPVMTSGEADPLDVSVAWTKDKDALTVAVVNPTRDSYILNLTLHDAELSGTGGEWWYISAPEWAYNEPGQPPQVVIEQGKVADVENGLPVPPLSVNIYILPSVTAAAAEGLDEEFDSATLSGWEHSDGVTVSGGVLTVPAENFASHAGDWSDFTLTVRLRLSGTGELVLGYAGGYRLLVGPEYLVLSRNAAGSEEELGSAAPVSIPWGNWFTITVQVEGGKQTIGLGDQTLIRAEDPSPLSGGISIEALGATVEVDRLTLKTGAVVSAAAPPAQTAAAGDYRYDFESGTAGWELGEAWSRVEISGGHALQGKGEGSALLSGVKGKVSYLKYRFMVGALGGGLNANIMTPAMRYTLEIGVRGLCFFTLAPGQELEHCIFGHYPILPGRFYTVEIYLSDESADVFIDGEGVVGTDLSAPAGEERTVEFEALAGGEGSVIVDDVEVKLGDVPAPSKARSPYSWKAGPDVGPFKDGIALDNFTLEGSESLTLRGGRYLAYGDITLKDNAHLTIAADAALYISDIFLHDNATLTMEGGYLLPVGAIIQPDDKVTKTPPDMLGAVYAVDSSTVTIQNAKLGIHFIDAIGQSRLTIKGTRFYTVGGGMVTPIGSSTIDVEDSTLGAITLVIPQGAVFKANGLKSGRYDDFDLQRDMEITGVDYSLTLKNVEIVPDTLATGYASDASERGWELEVSEGATVELTDSVLRKLTFQIPGGGPPLVFRDLVVGQPMNTTVGPVKLINSTVRGQWGFYVHGDRQVTIADSDGVWPLPYDTSQVTIENTRINEFDPRRYTGTLTFKDSRWYGPGEIIMDCDFLMRGTLDMKVTTLAWIGSTVTREYPIRVLDADGDPLAGVKITLTRGEEAVTATTDARGEALVRLKFTDDDYREKWTLTTDRGQSAEIEFFTSTPVIVR